ncbi:Uncharacterized conserved protein, DUF305 family [Erythrobacter litoralis]|uniref:DUF305 domain-containing protein n=1 Tax=Erythrobacter litoralis TaxID=39960 RepID=A0A074MCQ5_9SPHN|nr:DUF305 domain-containing protein [Erythrobacter litoralis]AOL22314.1 Uncharacterized conserved protein, DUF305 family [Erythrobacter litoralis]KEO89603.1 hypothetical protein EH32_03620 [Erythrobacter litoralis]
MTDMKLSGRAARAVLAAMLAGTSGIAFAQSAPIVQPGAPGQDSRDLSAEEAVKLAGSSYTSADVKFMQDMIVHHRQAVEMAALVADRTNTEEIVAVAGRIEASQEDEMAFMREWLEARGEPIVMTMAAGHDHHRHHTMMGMATPEQMQALAAAEGTEFDRQFLTLMIAHHEGALDMVDKLLALPGSAADPVLYRFIGDVENDQKSEIDRMDVVLAGLSPDPRAGLAAGFDDAGEAISNLRLVASLRKPAGFFNPDNPADLRPAIPPREDERDEADEALAEAAEDVAEAAASEDAEETPTRMEGEEESLTQFAERSPLLDFANTDMAFFDDIMVAGNYHGFNIYRLGEDGVPVLMSSVVCPGGQGDVSVVGNILVMSVEQTRGRVDCGLQGVEEDVSEDRFRGLRIFDISDLRRPRQVGGVQTCRGSHTHSIVSADDEKIVVYNSGTSSIRDEEELARCVDNPASSRTALFSIDVIEIPLADPSKARIVSSPRVFADAETGEIAGLWKGGESGEGAQNTRRTDQCHDITVFPSKNLAAGACSGNGILMEISDPYNPKRIDAVFDKGFAYWHSATFNNDGTKVVFTDEWGGGGRPRCRASDPMDWGANAIYDIVDGKLEFRSHYKMPAPQTEWENCVAHNGSIVPVPGRDIFVQSWYQGGISVMDFTDSANPKEIAFFDRGPIDEEQLVVGGFWSSYWYNGRIYGTEITRGIDVFALEPSEHLTEAEIAAAEAASYENTRFNPQTQTEVTWSEAEIEAAQASRKGG